MGENSSLVGKKFDSEPIYGDNDKHTKTKIKSYGGNVNTNVQGKKQQKKIVHVSLIIIDSVIKVNKENYPQTLFEECKYEIIKNKTENRVNDDLEPSSSDEFDSESDSETVNESDNDKYKKSDIDSDNDQLVNESQN